MGVLINRLVVSDSYPSPQSKQKMVAIGTRIIEILRSSARETMNLSSTGPIKVVMKYPKGREEKIEINKLEDSVVNMLLRLEEFELRVSVEDSFVITRYSEKEHYGRAIEIRVESPYKESLDKYAAGFVLLKDVLTSDLIFTKVRTRTVRLMGLIRKVAKKFLGDAYTEDFREVRVQQFRSDRVYFNIFGFIFSIKTRWED